MTKVSVLADLIVSATEPRSKPSAGSRSSLGSLQIAMVIGRPFNCSGGVDIEGCAPRDIYRANYVVT